MHKVKKTKKTFALGLMVVFAVHGLSCKHTPSTTETDAPVYPYHGFAYVAFINDDNANDVAKAARSVLSAKRVEMFVIGSSAGLDVLVRARDARTAVDALKESPDLIGRGIKIREASLQRQGTSNELENHAR